MASPPAASPLRNRDLTSRAYERLRQLIVDGRLSPGARLVECQLADRLGLSRTPIRSALQRLEQEGYVIEKDTARQSHPYVAPLTAEDGAELLLVLGQLEGAAARSAAALEAPERQEVARRMGELNDALRDLGTDPEAGARRFSKIDERFHGTLVDAGAGPRVAGIHASTRPQAERYFHLYAMSLGEALATSVEQHDRLVDAIRRGDPEAAEAAVVANWRTASERLRSVIERRGELGSW